MNQIPNIEETHNTREVEEVVKEFYKIFDTDNLWQGEDEWTKNVPIGNIEQWLRTTLHHQLQKARQDWLREEIVRLEGMKKTIDYTDSRVTALDRNKYYRLKGYEQGSNKTLQTIIDRYHSELDQDTELLNSVKEDWDKQAKNAMNGLDQEVSK